MSNAMKFLIVGGLLAIIFNGGSLLLHWLVVKKENKAAIKTLRFLMRKF